ncbi:HAD family hydrolase [Paenibacillus sp. ClWae2A]|uniref:HAD family hydrolase n=1 Tax=Paenibacillus sp. ClWae2A TaxID=3057177 RepID=UPI0028F52BB7|nr:HAD family hydrolase [Paenibacillus sp. ClWae2A]MDT9722444.1 HAD family hydrolase [Paenibacillus sp. ClWae2A]
MKAIFFDLGETLVHFEREKGKSLVSEICELTSRSEEDIKETMNKHFVIQNNTLNVLVENFSREIKYNSPHKIVDIIKNNQSIPHLFKDTNKVLNILYSRGYKLGIISNAFPWNCKSIFELGLPEFLSTCTYYSFTLGVAKPHIEIFEKVQLDLQLTNYEIAFVGDSIKSDVIGSKNANWLSILIDRTHKKKKMKLT